MSPAFCVTRGRIRGFPRVSGDEPKVILEAVVGGLFSPRERG